ncbi:hypothetical protein COV25_03120 [candidate division WWE3 bacterium CG10_big_fil_rev_8_21_14_0_10_35_32]|nr:MAG: hypothetical protein COV25_03120 [candidate division WWE3 bacterium CG10_big_fil_rev_8_21_14_0_10_35_32]
MVKNWSVRFLRWDFVCKQKNGGATEWLPGGTQWPLVATEWLLGGTTKILHCHKPRKSRVKKCNKK